MCTEWPLSKSSTLRGCCQGSSVIINGWLFPKTPPAWSSTHWQEEEGEFFRLLFLALPAHPSLPRTQQVLSDGSRAWLAPAPLLPTWQGSGHGQGAGSSVLLSPAQRNNSGSSKPPPPRHFLLLGNGDGNRNCPGGSAKCPGGHGLLKEQQCWGWRGLPASHPSGDVPASHGDTSQRCVALAGGSTSMVCVLQRAPLGLFVQSDLPAGHPKGLGCHWLLSPPI